MIASNDADTTDKNTSKSPIVYIIYLYELTLPTFLKIVCLLKRTPRPVKIFIGRIFLSSNPIFFRSFLINPKSITLVLLKNFIRTKYEYIYNRCEYPNCGVTVPRLFLYR